MSHACTVCLLCAGYHSCLRRICWWTVGTFSIIGAVFFCKSYRWSRISVLIILIVQDRWSLPSRLFLTNQAELTRVTNSQHIQAVSYKRLMHFMLSEVMLYVCRCCRVSSSYRVHTMNFFTWAGGGLSVKVFNPFNAKLNPICHLLTLLGAHPILHVSRTRVKVYIRLL